MKLQERLEKVTIDLGIGNYYKIKTNHIDELNILIEENIENIEAIKNHDISALNQIIEYYDDLKNDLIQKLEEQREWLQKEYLKNSDILKEDFVDQLMQNGETFYNQVDNKIHQLKRKQEELQE